jgi:hypothetical protein
MNRRRAPRGGCYCNGRLYRGGQFLPKRKTESRERKTLDALSEVLIHRVESDDLPPDVGYNQAMRRVLRRRSKPTVKDLAALDRRRRQAMAVLADHPDSIVRQHFAGLLAAYPNV